jgi:hypothetical protein
LYRGAISSPSGEKLLELKEDSITGDELSKGINTLLEGNE